MKSSRSVCLVCRFRLATQAPRRASQWRAEARYSTGASSRASTTRGDAGAQESTTSSDSKPVIRHFFVAERAPRTSSNKTPTLQPTTTPRPRHGVPKASVDMDALFKQIVEREDSGGLVKTESGETRDMDMTLIQDIGKLQQMLATDLPGAYNFLKTELFPSISRKGVLVPHVYFSTVSNLMHQIVTAKSNSIKDPELPTVAEIFRVCADIGEMKVSDWTLLVGKLVEALCSLPNDAPVSSLTPTDGLRQKIESMMTDLIESWKVLSLPKTTLMKATGDDGEMIDGFWLPRLDKYSVGSLRRDSNKFTLALASLFPLYHPNQLDPKVTVLAIATFAMLMDDTRSTPSIRQSASRFTAKLASLLVQYPISDKALRHHIHQSFPSMEGYITAKWPRIMTRLEESQLVESMSVDNATVSKKLKPFNAASIESRLSKAYGHRDLASVDRLWEELTGGGKIKTKEQAAALREHPNLFNSFINMYMAMRRPDKAILVWNTLSKVGLRPSLKTWNVMLDGCKKARNLSGLRIVWDKLIESQTPLDVAIWTTRIAGLVECGDPKSAVAALDEMAIRWDKRGKNHAVQPTIQPVNAALTGLVRLGKHEAAQKLLRWASHRGIQPDIRTFNTLLRPLVRDGRDEEVKALFNAMKQAGVHADEATFTIVLDGAVAKLDLSEPDQQAKLVSAVFAQMQAAGLEANLHTYGKMVYLLLRSGDRAKESVKAVLAHLWASGFELSSHIYTMLVEHYFSRRPPDLAAVQSLLERRRVLDYDDMDRVFYERVIKGYSQAGQTDTAMELYRKLDGAGFLVELDTQSELLLALLRKGDGEAATELVRSTVRRFKDLHGESYRSSQHARFWKHGFWQVAQAQRLFDPEQT